MSNIPVSIYDPETGTILAHYEVMSYDSLDNVLAQGFAIAEGIYDPAVYFINPATGKANKHKSDATKPKVSAARQWSGIRTRRNTLLDQYRWTIAADSPLSEPNKGLWLDYLKALQAVTLDLADPAKVVWPEQPGFAYPPSTKAAKK